MYWNRFAEKQHSGWSSKHAPPPPPPPPPSGNTHTALHPEILDLLEVALNVANPRSTPAAFNSRSLYIREVRINGRQFDGPTKKQKTKTHRLATDPTNNVSWSSWSKSLQPSSSAGRTKNRKLIEHFFFAYNDCSCFLLRILLLFVGVFFSSRSPCTFPIFNHSYVRGNYLITLTCSSASLKNFLLRIQIFQRSSVGASTCFCFDTLTPSRDSSHRQHSNPICNLAFRPR